MRKVNKFRVVLLLSVVTFVFSNCDTIKNNDKSAKSAEVKKAEKRIIDDGIISKEDLQKMLAKKKADENSELAENCPSSFLYRDATDNCKMKYVCLDMRALEAHFISGQLSFGQSQANMRVTGANNCFEPYDGKVGVRANYFLEIPCEHIAKFKEQLPDQYNFAGALPSSLPQLKLYLGNEEVQDFSYNQLVVNGSNNMLEAVKGEITEEHYVAICDTTLTNLRCGTQIYIDFRFPYSHITDLGKSYYLVFFINEVLEHEHADSNNNIDSHCLFENATTLANFNYIMGTPEEDNCGHQSQHLSVLKIPICGLSFNDFKGQAKPVESKGSNNGSGHR